MKKYIFGLISAICLIGAGCETFEDYVPTDMGVGPSVEASIAIEEGTIDAFRVKVVPAEDAMYYAYLLTTDSLESVDAMTLLQRGYENAVLYRTDTMPKVEFVKTGQALNTDYYVYAVASDHQGLCGEVAVASLNLPDKVAPYLVKKPQGNQYVASNNGKTIQLEYNEPVVRGEGVISFVVTGADGVTSYASGVVESVVVNSNMVTINLPETVVFDANEDVSYVFLDLAQGAFLDASGNASIALKGGVDDEGLVDAPWWEYDPEAPEPVEGMVGTYGFVFQEYDVQTGALSDGYYATDTEFALKYANRADTVLINNFFDADPQNGIYNLPLEAGMTPDGFSIADFQILNQMEMQGGGNTYNVLWVFIGFANTEDEQFEKINFVKTYYDDGSYDYVADRWVGILFLDYDALQSGNTENANLGYGIVCANSFFIEGTVHSSTAAAMASMNLVKNKLTIKSVNTLAPAERAKAQMLLNDHSVRRQLMGK